MALKFICLFSAVLVAYCSAKTVPQIFEKTVPYVNSFRTFPSNNSSKASTRIVNGYEAATNQFPYQVSVLAPTEEGLVYVFGGSIISPEWVLTAAHDTYPHRNFILRFGSNNLWDGGYVQHTNVAVNHPEYDQTDLSNDISLLRVLTPLDLQNGPLRAIRLPGEEFRELSFVGSRSRVAGWGVSNSGQISERLLFVDLEVIDNARCRQVYGANRVRNHVLCGVGWHNRNQATCGGDSGSALAILHEGEWVQIGVAAFGALNACDRGFPSGFMRVTSFIDWIQQTVNQVGGGNPELPPEGPPSPPEGPVPPEAPAPPPEGPVPPEAPVPPPVNPDAPTYPDFSDLRDKFSYENSRM